MQAPLLAPVGCGVLRLHTMQLAQQRRTDVNRTLLIRSRPYPDRQMYPCERAPADDAT